MEFVDKLKNLFGKKEEPGVKVDPSPAAAEHQSVLSELANKGKLEGPSIGETQYDQHQIGEFIRFLKKFKSIKDKAPGAKQIDQYYDKKDKGEF